MNESDLEKVYLAIGDFKYGFLTFKTFSNSFVTQALSAIPIYKAGVFTEQFYLISRRDSNYNVPFSGIDSKRGVLTATTD
jgi:hypothetical protein